jgi:glycosyltransferase involved in cell wall biosynthesis
MLIKNKRMRVAFISTVHGHGWPGSEFLWGETAGKLLDQGHEVFARCSVDFRNSKVLQGLIGKGLCYDPVQPTLSRLARLMSRFLNPLSKLRAWNPELVVVSAGSAFDISYSPPLSRFLLESGIPFIPICHFNAETFWVDESSRSVMQKIYEKAAASVFVSADNHRITERQLALKIENFYVIRPPFPLVLDGPLPWPEVVDECWNFACVARLEPRWKGQDVLFEVLERPEWKQRQWKLNLYGEGSEEGYLRNLAQHYGINERVVFHGFVRDRSEIWRNNHIQVFPTRGEGGPMVLTEGMMAGRCALISDCGNAKEYVQDGVDGFLADFATPEIFSRGLELAWVRKKDWRTMGITAYKKIAKLAHAENPVEMLMRVISENL